MILARCKLSELGEYNGKLLSGTEKVFLNLVTGVEGANIAFKELIENRNVYCVTIEGDPEKLPEVPFSLKGTEKENRVYFRTVYPEVRVPDRQGYITLCELPEDYHNMRELYDLSMKYPDGKLRFIGGNILEIPGIYIGRTDLGKEKMSSVYNGVYDAYLEADVSEINNIEVLKAKVSKKALKDLEGVKEEKKSKGSSPKAPKAEKPMKVSFTNLFSGDSVDF